MITDTLHERYQVTFTGVDLDEAVKGAPIDNRHPYIHWPNFGYNRPSGGSFMVELVELTSEDTPNSFINSLLGTEGEPLTAIELAELVGHLNGSLNGSKVFGFAEKYPVAGTDGYPYAYNEDGLKCLGLWYFLDEWPQGAVGAVRRPL